MRHAISSATTRRRFFGGGLAAALGLALPATRGAFRPHADGGAGDAPIPQQPSPEARLRALGIQLPTPSQPIATYVPTVLVGDLLFVAGMGPRWPEGMTPRNGKVGRDLTLEQAREAARYVGINILASVRAAVGSLDRVSRLVRTLGMVNAIPEFTEQPQVINGFSDLIVEIFGETAGKGARAAVGMGSLPGSIPVEIETIWQVRV